MQDCMSKSFFLFLFFFLFFESSKNKNNTLTWSWSPSASWFSFRKAKGWLVGRKSIWKCMVCFEGGSHLKNNWFAVNGLKHAKPLVWCVKVCLRQVCNGFFFFNHCNIFCFFVCIQIQWLWKHLHQTQWQSGQDTFKLPVRLPHQQTEGQHFTVAFIFPSDLLQASHQMAFFFFFVLNYCQMMVSLSLPLFWCHIPRLAVCTLDNDT